MSVQSTPLSFIDTDVPPEGALYLGKFAIHLTAGVSQTLDFSAAVRDGRLSSLRMLITDAVPSPVSFTFTSGQTIVHPSNAGVWMPLLMPNPPIITIVSAFTQIIRIGFTNVLLPPQIRKSNT